MRGVAFLAREAPFQPHETHAAHETRVGILSVFVNGILGPVVFGTHGCTARSLIARKLGYARYELSWVLEDNTPMRRICDAGGAKVYKTYRLYEKALV